jgi:hypothetical protein
MRKQDDKGKLNTKGYWKILFYVSLRKIPCFKGRLRNEEKMFMHACRPGEALFKAEFGKKYVEAGVGSHV